MCGNYFYKQESEQFAFLRVPKELFINPGYKNLPCESKLLYSLLLDRVGLSRQNNWIDEHGRIYIYFTIDEIRSTFGYSRGKAIKLLTQLETFGLLEKKRQGLGKPNILYLKKLE